jgi:hypothetical protein
MPSYYVTAGLNDVAPHIAGGRSSTRRQSDIVAFLATLR